ncbi:MBL fold metallo-hydrolase [Natronomonas sp. F2-12]|uniref:MBL fold metallo-hydrolase n=1 Tax=Natronomonas aquatica TaxID=2841590 RepID=A0A9R1D563_9EURY|nr:MBL fold metallo-hydrolase [Natronomonas aquatica]MCQ4332038.1 MBL fold metallo-hydrolase [Natronomonas aquatica]
MDTFQVTDGVYGIDTGLFDSSFTSVYLFDDAEPTLVDSGAAATVDAVLEGLNAVGVPPEDLANVVLSHVHSDHSGGAGDLLEYAPGADVYIHEMTAPHLSDPSELIESSRQAMGEQFEAMGEQRPVPEGNIVPVPEAGTTVDIGSNTLELVYAPGHSPDHFAVWNPERGLCFAAECLGGYLAEADRWTPPSTLPNFDVEDSAVAIDRLEALDPDRIVFPHFGVWSGEPAAAFETARETLYRFDERVMELYDATGSIEATRRAVADELLDIAPPYDGRIESFYSTLLTDGYLKYHGVEV